jgi:hypothetical protein
MGVYLLNNMTNNMKNTNEIIEVQYKNVTELNRGDVCFIESGDRRTTGIIMVHRTEQSKSGKFTTIWCYVIEQSDYGQLATYAGDQKHPKYGRLYYMSKSNKHNVEMIS